MVVGRKEESNKEWKGRKVKEVWKEVIKNGKEKERQKCGSCKKERENETSKGGVEGRMKYARKEGMNEERKDGMKEGRKE